MKKLTSFLTMCSLCCASALAQYQVGDIVTDQLPEDMLVKIGTAQREMVPGKWYFLHSPRNANSTATEFDQDGQIQRAGGLVTDRGVGFSVFLTTSSAIEELTAEEGVPAKNHTASMVRFVAVDGEEGAFNIQFGTGNWLSDSPGGGTVNRNNYIAGNAGKYNFYLVTIAGEPNTAGRFGWNKYDMQQRVDNNGAGNGVVFWSEGETTGESEGWTVSEEIMGNKIWQIYDIQVVGTVDKWDEAFNALLNDYSAISNMQEGAFVDNMRNGINVGTQPGNYLAEYVEAFLKIWDEVDELMMEVELDGLDVLNKRFESVEALEAYNKALVDAYNAIINNKVPLAATNIAPGYYTINSMMEWYEISRDTIFYAQEEADSVNAEYGYVEGDDGFVTTETVKEIASKQVPAPIKALCSKFDTGSSRNWVAWGNLEETTEFLWKVEVVEGEPTKYRLINMYQGEMFNGIGQSTNSRLGDNDTTKTCFDYRGEAVAPVTGENVVVYNIRGSHHAENGYNYIHAGGHNGGAGNNGWAVGWTDGDATQWYMVPVDAATADQWLNGPEAQIKAQIKKADSIVAAFPEQLSIAKDMVTTVYEEDSVVVTADQFYSQYTTEDAQSIPEGQTVYDFMLDGKQSTYWHSKWENGAVGQKVHYLQVNAAEELNGLYCVKLQRRPVAGDHITELVVVGFVEEPTDETQFADGVELGTLKLPLSANNETIVTNTFDATGMNYLRFYSTTTAAAAAGGGANRGYWHASAFNVFKASEAKRYETTQYDARQAQADALKAAIEAWVAGAYTADDVAVLEDEAYKTAYSNLIAAAEAWGAVYVNPAALRSAIATAPASKLFVIGNNPGQWKEGVVTPATVVEAAEAYNAAGAYTAEASKGHIDAIAEAITNVYAQANPIETGKWYRIKFASEEMYDEYEWSKTGAQATISHDIEVSPALFGKTIAAANNKTLYQTYTNEDGDEAETATYYVEAVEEAVDGQRLGFFEEVENEGMDLFRFIKATDSTYMMQNKATGLFVRAGYPASLSAIPSYFYTKAIGAGASLIGSKNIFGGAEQGYAYLHGERATNLLTTWSSSNLESNSMLFIEEVEAVTEAPSTEYLAKLWPGKLNTYTMPVDITVVDGAKAYTADLVEGENEQTVVLAEITEMPIKAGTPFILVAESEGEYVSASQATASVTEELKAELGVDQLSRNDLLEVQQRVNDMYSYVELKHGMEVSTAIQGGTDLSGTMFAVRVQAGKGIVAKENGFSHTLIDTNVPAFGAYIMSDFDAESEVVLTPINIVYGSIPEPEPFDPMANTMFSENTTVWAGEEFVLPIKMNNTESIISYEFELSLPQGFSVKSNGRGEYAITSNSTRVPDYKYVTKRSPNGNLRIAAYSMTNEAIRGTSGIVAYITVVSDGSLAKGEYQISLNNIVMTKSDASTSFEIEQTTSTVSVMVETDGDLNHDGELNISDVSELINIWILGHNDAETMARADLNHDGKINVTDISAVIKLYLEYAVSDLSASRVRANAPVDMANHMYAAPVEINAGETQEVKINLTNHNVNVVSAEFDLSLPDGFEVATDANGKPEISLGSRLGGYEILTRHNTDGTLRVAFYSMSNTPVIGSEGDILVVKMRATEQVANGEYELQINNQLLTNSDIKSVVCASTASSIRVGMETSIDAVGAEGAKKVVYDLNGRRTEAKQHGVYIINNKKVLK